MVHLGLSGEWLRDIAFKLALSAFIIFFSGSLLTLFLTPSYSITTQYISALALSRYGNIFNISAMVTGILLFPIYIVIYPIFHENSATPKSLLRITIFTGMSAMINLVFVGGFPLTIGSQPHLIVAVLFFLLLLIHILSMNLIVQYTGSEMIYRELHNKKFLLLGYVIIFLILLMFSVVLFDPFSSIPIVNQKLVVTLSFFYLFYLIRKLQICHEVLQTENPHKGYWNQTI